MQFIVGIFPIVFNYATGASLTIKVRKPSGEWDGPLAMTEEQPGVYVRSYDVNATGYYLFYVVEANTSKLVHFSRPAPYTN